MQFSIYFVNKVEMSGKNKKSKKKSSEKTLGG